MAPIKLGVVGLSVDGEPLPRILYIIRNRLFLTLGWFKNAHLPSLQALADSYTLTAAATSRKESADQVAQEYGIKTFSGADGAAQLAREEDVEMVVIALKTPLHKPTAMQVLEARKPIYLEWPLGNGLQEAIEMADAAKRAGIRTMIGLQARQDPAIRKAKELLEQGKIGKVLSSNFVGYGGSWGAQVPARDAYTLDAPNGATIISIPFGHFVDSLVYLLGDLTSLSAYKATLRRETVIEGTGKTVRATAEDQLIVQGQLESGALVGVHYKGGTAPAGSEGLVWEIEGEEGVITFKAAGVGHVQVRSPFTATQPSNACLAQLISPKLYLNGEQVQLPEDKLGNIGRLYEAFAKDDKGGYNDWDHAVRVHRIVDAVERSCREGKRTRYL